MISKMRAAIRGIGVVGGFGSGVEKLSQTLSSGKRAPKLTTLSFQKRVVEMPVYLCDTAPLDAFINKRALRRVDHFSRIAVLGSFLALADADMLQADHTNFAVIVATGYGASNTTFSFLDSAMDNGDACASPTLFSNSVHNAAAAHISILLKSGGPNITISQFEMSVPAAVSAACQLLENSKVDAVLLGSVDEYCSVLGYCWKRFFEPDPAVIMKPLEWQTQSAIIGEGSAFFLLTRDDGDKPKYGFITDVQIDHLGKSKPRSRDDAFLFLGADGQKKAAAHYAQHVPPATQAAVYSPLYGSFPTALAVDMAIAAVSFREGRIYATPSQAGENSGLKIFKKEQRLDYEQICCLKFSCNGEYAIITIAGA